MFHIKCCIITRATLKSHKLTPRWNTMKLCSGANYDPSRSKSYRTPWRSEANVRPEKVCECTSMRKKEYVSHLPIATHRFPNLRQTAVFGIFAIEKCSTRCWNRRELSAWVGSKLRQGTNWYFRWTGSDSSEQFFAATLIKCVFVFLGNRNGPWWHHGD